MSWLNATAAAKRLGVHRRTITRMAQAGEIETRETEAGTPEYLVEDDQTERVVTGELVRLVRALVEPYERLMGLYASENQAQRLRLSELEKLHGEMVTAREDALDRRAARELEASRERVSIERSDKAFGALQKLVGDVMKSSKAKRLLDSLTKDQLEVISEAEGWLTAEQRALVKHFASSKSDDVTTTGEESCQESVEPPEGQPSRNHTE